MKLHNKYLDSNKVPGVKTRGAGDVEMKINTFLLIVCAICFIGCTDADTNKTEEVKVVKEINQIPEIRELFEGMKGHNFALPDCVKFIMECLGHGDRPDYWDIAAITGDTVAQVYNRNESTRCDYSVSGYLAGREHVEYVFNAMGYDIEYVTADKVNADWETYRAKVVEYIDNGIPVLAVTNINYIPQWDSDVGTYCLAVGYMNGGDSLQLLVGGTVPIIYPVSGTSKLDLVFVGERTHEVSLEEIYVSAIKKLPHWLTMPERDGMFFGAAAFRAWADDVEAGRFADLNIDMWANYGVYVCNLATSAGGMTGGAIGCLAETSPLYTDLESINEQIDMLMGEWANGICFIWNELEELGAGMHTNSEPMNDEAKCAEIAAVLRDYADRIDQALVLIEEVIRIIEN